jgi:hypothetical protein
MKTDYSNNINVLRTGYYSSVFLAIITVITFGLALTAIPNSGAFCPEDCFEYPYLDTLSEYPGDYLWMFPATLLLIVFMIFVVGVHSIASDGNRIFGRISICFAMISTIVLLVCYFVQFTVIPASLSVGETEGITLLTQYNPHGVFIAMEELGYIMMSFAFLFLSRVIEPENRIGRFIRWIYISAFVLTLVSFALVYIIYGIERQDRFEVIVISICWLVLIVNGILTGIVLKRLINNKTVKIR